MQSLISFGLALVFIGSRGAEVQTVSDSFIEIATEQACRTSDFPRTLFGTNKEYCFEQCTFPCLYVVMFNEDQDCELFNECVLEPRDGFSTYQNQQECEPNEMVIGSMLIKLFEDQSGFQGNDLTLYFQMPSAQEMRLIHLGFIESDSALMIDVEPTCVSNTPPEHCTNENYWSSQSVGCVDVYKGIFPFDKSDENDVADSNALSLISTGTRNNVFQGELLARLEQDVEFMGMVLPRTITLAMPFSFMIDIWADLAVDLGSYWPENDLVRWLDSVVVTKGMARRHVVVPGLGSGLMSDIGIDGLLRTKSPFFPVDYSGPNGETMTITETCAYENIFEDDYCTSEFHYRFSTTDICDFDGSYDMDFVVEKISMVDDTDQSASTDVPLRWNGRLNVALFDECAQFTTSEAPLGGIEICTDRACTDYHHSLTPGMHYVFRMWIPPSDDVHETFSIEDFQITDMYVEEGLSQNFYPTYLFGGRRNDEMGNDNLMFDGNFNFIQNPSGQPLDPSIKFDDSVPLTETEDGFLVEWTMMIDPNWMTSHELFQSVAVSVGYERTYVNQDGTQLAKRWRNEIQFSVLPRPGPILAKDIPRAHTPWDGVYGYRRLVPVLSDCEEDIPEEIPDLRGFYKSASGEERVLIEQCGDRLVISSGGVVYDFMRIDGSEENGARDIRKDCICEEETEVPIKCSTSISAHVDGDCIELISDSADRERWCSDTYDTIKRFDAYYETGGVYPIYSEFEVFSLQEFPTEQGYVDYDCRSWYDYICESWCLENTFPWEMKCGWNDCLSCSPCMGTTEAPPDEGLFTMSGDCVVQGDCVSSGNYPSPYGNLEICEITINEDVRVGTPDGIWRVENSYDHIFINSVDVESISQVPSILGAGSSITWQSDSSVSYIGWQLCFCPADAEDCDICCTAYEASCMACQYGQDILTYCANSPSTPGCSMETTAPQWMDCRSGTFNSHRVCDEFGSFCEDSAADENGCMSCANCDSNDMANGMCPECEDYRGQCETWCPGSPYNWEEKCTWNGCAACTECVEDLECGDLTDSNQDLRNLNLGFSTCQEAMAEGYCLDDDEHTSIGTDVVNACPVSCGLCVCPEEYVFPNDYYASIACKNPNGDHYCSIDPSNKPWPMDDCSDVRLGSTLEPTSRPTDAICPGWCAGMNDWDEVCAWRACKFCAQCSETSAVITTSPETSTTTTTATTMTPPMMCKDWCDASRLSWAEKCVYNACKGCDGCSSDESTDRTRTTMSPSPSPTPSPTMVPTDSPTSDSPEPPVSECPTWCARKNNWAEVCSWNGCKSCSECTETPSTTMPEQTTSTTMPEETPSTTIPEQTDSPSNPCPSTGCAAWCPKSAFGWDEKCNFSGCAGCSECCESRPRETVTPETTTTSQTTIPTPTPDPGRGECKSWCEGSRTAWNEKCSWNSCGTCSQCYER